MSTFNIPLFHWRSKTTSLNYRQLPPDLALLLTLSSSTRNYPCVEHISWSNICISHLSVTVFIYCTCSRIIPSLWMDKKKTEADLQIIRHYNLPVRTISQYRDQTWFFIH